MLKPLTIVAKAIVIVCCLYVCLHVRISDLSRCFPRLNIALRLILCLFEQLIIASHIMITM